MNFLIASLKHTNKGHEHITWWGRFHRGYTPVVAGYCGRYCYAEARDMNDGEDYIAVPEPAVIALLSPEPYWKPGARFYDQRGPVVENSKRMWDALFAARLIPEGRQFAKPKPEVFKGARRSFYPLLQAA